MEKFGASIRILYWSIGILIFTGLTIRDIILLVNEFQNNNVGTSMRIVANNKTTKPPVLVFTIPRSQISLIRIVEKVCNGNESHLMQCNECQALAEHGWDVWNDMNISDNDTIIDCYHRISVIMGRKLLNDSMEVLNATNLNWSLPILDAAWDLLDCINSLDFLVDFGDQWTKWNMCYGQHDIDLALSTKKVDEIHESIVAILCDYVSFSGAGGGENCMQIFDMALGVLYGNTYSVQLNLQESISFSLTLNSTNQRNIVWPALETGSIFTIAEDLNSATLSNNIGKTVFASDPMAASTPNITEFVYLKYSITSMIIGRSQDRTPCYNDSNPIVCQANCVLQKIVHTCHCIPFTFRKSVISTTRDSYPYCTISLYSKCPLNKTLENERCDAQCSNPCEYLTYSWHITNSASKTELKTRFYLVISHIPTPFIEFRAVIKNSDEQFFSQIAAIFNLYLGFSGISLVSGILIGVDVFRKWYLTRRQRSSQVGLGENRPENHESKDNVTRATQNEPTTTTGEDIRMCVREVLVSMKIEKDFENTITRIDKLEQKVDAMRFRRKIPAE